MITIKCNYIVRRNDRVAIDYRLLFIFFDVGVNQEAVHFRVDVFDCDLKAVETTSFGDLNFFVEVFNLRGNESLQ